MKIALAAALVTLPALVQAQEEVPPFHEYDPPSTLVVPEHPVTRAKYPFVDVHNHQFGMLDDDLGELLAAMDALNMAVMVNLSGRGFRRVTGADGTTRSGLEPPEHLKRMVEKARRDAPGRFVIFTNVDFSAIGEPGWTEGAVAELATDVASGAQGLKIYKSLGMGVVDTAGARVPVNDPRLDPIWAKCGELGVPVLIHTADPAPFWQAKDGANERLFELMERPGRYRGPEASPSWEELIAEQHDVFRKHPGTKFINAHLGWMGNDLGRLGRLLDELPNVYTEIGAVLAELGRQPRFAREFFVRWQDRVLFGKDSWAPAEYHVYFRVLETADEYFDYYRRRHAFWKVYGLDLPDEVLRKVYYENALALFPGIDRSFHRPPATEASAGIIRGWPREPVGTAIGSSPRWCSSPSWCRRSPSAGSATTAGSPPCSTASPSWWPPASSAGPSPPPSSGPGAGG
jgi:predicted TIM-barrel fold metal-dependent hydrolase